MSKITGKSYCTRAALIHSLVPLQDKGELDTETGDPEGRQPREEGGRDWSHVGQSTGRHQKPGEAREGPPEASERAGPHRHLNSGLPASRSARTQISVVLKPVVGICSCSPRKPKHPLLTLRYVMARMKGSP